MYKLDIPKYFEFSNFGRNHFYTDDLKDLFGIKVEYQNPSIRQIKIAKVFQICSEEIGFHFLKHYII